MTDLAYHLSSNSINGEAHRRPYLLNSKQISKQVRSLSLLTIYLDSPKSNERSLDNSLTHTSRLNRIPFAQFDSKEPSSAERIRQALLEPQLDLERSVDMQIGLA